MNLIREINDEILGLELLEQAISDLFLLTEANDNDIEWEPQPKFRMDMMSREKIRKSVDPSGENERRKRVKQSQAKKGDIIRAVLNGKALLGRVISADGDTVAVDFPAARTKKSFTANELKATDLKSSIAKIKTSTIDTAKKNALTQQFDRIASILKQRGDARLFTYKG